MCYAALTYRDPACSCCGEPDDTANRTPWVSVPICKWCRYAWYDGTDTNEPEEIAAVSRRMRAAGTINLHAVADREAK